MRTVELGNNMQVQVEDTDKAWVDGRDGWFYLNGERKFRVYNIDIEKKEAFNNSMRKNIKEGLI